MKPELLTIKQVQEILGVSRTTVYEYINDTENPLPVLYLGERTPRISNVALIDWIEDQGKLLKNE